MKPEYKFIENLSFEELVTLHSLVASEMHRKNPDTIADNQRMGKYFAACEVRAAKQESYCQRVVAALRNLQPGTLIKMRGCRDGKGLREFIRWDSDDSLVCWQIIRSPHRADIKSNQVTTHMPDKVSWIMLNGKEIPIGKLVA